MALVRADAEIYWDFEVPTEKIAIDCPFCGARFIVCRTGKEFNVIQKSACPHADWWEDLADETVRIAFYYPERDWDS